MPVTIGQINNLKDAWRALDEQAREINRLEKLIIDLQARVAALEGP
jgi:hypothetical protein